MIDYTYVECTSAVTQALVHFSHEFPHYKPKEIQYVCSLLRPCTVYRLELWSQVTVGPVKVFLVCMYTHVRTYIQRSHVVMSTLYWGMCRIE